MKFVHDNHSRCRKIPSKKSISNHFLLLSRQVKFIFDIFAYRITHAIVAGCRLIVSAHCIPTAVECIAAHVICNTLLNTVSVITIDAGAFITTLASRHTMTIDVTLRWICRAIAKYAFPIYQAEFRNACALVAWAQWIVRAFLIFTAMCIFVTCICALENNCVSEKCLFTRYYLCNECILNKTKKKIHYV